MRRTYKCIGYKLSILLHTVLQVIEGKPLLTTGVAKRCTQNHRLEGGEGERRFSSKDKKIAFWNNQQEDWNHRPSRIDIQAKQKNLGRLSLITINNSWLTTSPIPFACGCSAYELMKLSGRRIYWSKWVVETFGPQGRSHFRAVVLNLFFTTPPLSNCPLFKDPWWWISYYSKCIVW